MSARYAIAVVGAGPAGMAAATVGSAHGARVLLVDEQPAPGGQIYRSVGRPIIANPRILGTDYLAGRDLVKGLAASGVDHLPDATVWHVSPGGELGISENGRARLVRADQIILATGAHERPFPVPGWTLPGVMTAGGAQVLLKSAGLAEPDAVFAGTGPLLYLMAYQYLQAGVPVRAILDTTPPGNRLRALRHLPRALANGGELARGHRWLAALRAAGVPLTKGVQELRCIGEDALGAVAYRRGSEWRRLETERAFLHQGVVPGVNLAMAAGCGHRWSHTQLCWHAVTDDWCESGVPGIAIAGDAAAINGALAAEAQGRLAAYGALHRLGIIDAPARDRLAAPARRALRRARSTRAFLDVMFRPAARFRTPPEDDVLVCRCEEVSAARVRAAIGSGCHDPNRLKGLTRCGMGPCQGRLCGLTVTELIAASLGVPASSIPPPRLRAPVKPLRLETLAALQATPGSTGT